MNARTKALGKRISGPTKVAKRANAVGGTLGTLLKHGAVAGAVGGAMAGGAGKTRRGASNVLGSVLSARSNAKAKRFDRERGIIKTARGYKGAPDIDDKGFPTDAFKYRQAAEGIRNKYKKGGVR